MITEKITGYHFSKADNYSRNGSEQPFKLGEYRKLDPAKVELCSYGYHGCRQPSDLLLGEYIYGPVLELCEYDTPVAEDKHKFVSAGKKLLQRVNVEKELRLFAADCAEHVLHLWTAKYPEDATVAACISGIRDYAEGKISKKQLDKLRQAAKAANAVHYAAYYVAYYVAYYAAHHAAYYAAANAAHWAACATANAAIGIVETDVAGAVRAAAYIARTAADAAAGAKYKKEQQWQAKQFNKLMLEVLK